jgi:hypothetical protein
LRPSHDTLAAKAVAKKVRQAQWRSIVYNRHLWFGLLGLAGAITFKLGPAWSRWLAVLAVGAMFWYERQDFFRMLAVFTAGREYIDEGKTYRNLDREKDQKFTDECHRSHRILHLAMTVNGMAIHDYFSHEPFEPLVRARGKLDSAVRLEYGVTLKATEVKALMEFLDTQDERFKGINI